VKLLRAVFDQTNVSPIYHERMLRLATLSSDGLLCEALVSTLTERLMDGTLAPTETLIVADRLQIRDLQGVAYYAQLLALQKDNSDQIAFPANCQLAKDQRIRLLTGYWSLMRRWERLQDSPVAIQQSPSCPTQLHNLACRPRWDAEWRKHAHAQSTTQYTSADVLGKIQAMWILLQNSFPQNNIHPNLQHFLQQTIINSNNLPQHFPIPPQQNLHLPISLQQQNLHFANNLPQQTIPGPNNPNIHGGNNVQQNVVIVERICQMYTATGFPLCTQKALAETKKVADSIRASLLDFFSEDALGLTQDPHSVL